METLNLDACIECRLCDRVCPSAIPLTQYFIEAKQAVATANDRQAEADQAQARYQKRETRLSDSNRIIKTRPSDDDRKSLLERLGE
jgi:electron transport complex protein RnfC